MLDDHAVAVPLIGRSPRRRLEVLSVCAITLSLGLVAASCGDAKRSSHVTVSARSAPAPSTNPYKAGLAYAACMRAHGVPHPNPDREGDFHLTPAQERRLKAAGHAKVEAATRACFKYLRPVVSTKPLSAKAKAQAVKVLEQLRTCVRKLGFELGAPVVKDMTLGRAFFGFLPGESRPSTAMTRAEHTCERRVQLAKKIDAIIAADRTPV
jgi:hypothetical protein